MNYLNTTGDDDSGFFPASCLQGCQTVGWKQMEWNCIIASHPPSTTTFTIPLFLAQILSAICVSVDWCIFGCLSLVHRSKIRMNHHGAPIEPTTPPFRSSEKLQLSETFPSKNRKSLSSDIVYLTFSYRFEVEVRKIFFT
jgi:hypothetical protein